MPHLYAVQPFTPLRALNADIPTPLHTSAKFLPNSASLIGLLIKKKAAGFEHSVTIFTLLNNKHAVEVVLLCCLSWD